MMTEDATTTKTAGLRVCPESMRPHVDRVLAGEYDLPGNLRWKEGAIARVLDIGANVGAFSVWARAKWPDCDVIAYEPVPENYTAYLENLDADFRRITPRNFAVSDAAGRRTLYLGATNEGEASFHDNGEQDMDRHIEVDTVDAREMTGAHFVKIDAEGEEVPILRVLPLDTVRGIGLEWHRPEDREWIEERLGKAGFALVKDDVICHERGTQVWARPEWTDPVPPADAPGGKDLFIALPVYGGYEAHFTHSMFGLISRRPAPVKFRVGTLSGDSLVPRARNVLAARFLRSSATHLLFIDTDLIFSPDHIAQICSHDVPIVAGLYPKKQRDLAWVCNLLDDPVPARPDGLVPAKYAGTGFLMIAREVFEAMREAHPEIEYDPDEGDESGVKWDFFPTGVWVCPKTGRRRYLSEDWYFCQRARDLGYEILIDTSIVCKHVGTFIYPLADPFAEETKAAVERANAGD